MNWFARYLRFVRLILVLSVANLGKISFTNPPTPQAKRSDSTALQFHTLRPSLRNLAEFVRGDLCGNDGRCREYAASVLSAKSIDISYDRSSRSLTVSGLRPSPEGGWSEVIRKHSQADHVEVGLLGCERVAGTEELKSGGLLGVVGEDKQLSMSSASLHSHAGTDVYRTDAILIPVPSPSLPG